jgi:hypothetical protein
VTPARSTDAQAGGPARGIARRKGFFQAFVDIDLGDGILPRLSQRCREALTLLMLCAPGRRAARAGRWIGYGFSVSRRARTRSAALMSDSHDNARVRWSVPHFVRASADRAIWSYSLGSSLASLSARNREVLSNSACCLAKYSDVPADLVSPAAMVRNIASARAFMASGDSPIVNDPIAISKQVNADGSNRGNVNEGPIGQKQHFACYGQWVPIEHRHHPKWRSTGALSRPAGLSESQLGFFKKKGPPRRRRTPFVSRPWGGGGRSGH